MPSLPIVALGTLAVMVAGVVAAWRAGRPRDDGLDRLRAAAYSDEPMTAVGGSLSSRPPLDVDALPRRFGGDAYLVRGAIEAFRRDAPELTRAIRMALDLGDARELHRSVGLLRGLAEPLGARPVLDSLQQLEQAAATDLTLAWRAADVFDREMDRLDAQLKRVLAAMEPPPEEV